MNLEHYVPVFHIENWEDFEKIFRNSGPLVFRGQSDCSWDLTTNYEREFGTNASRESSMIKRCIAEGHLFVEHPPADNDYVSWLAEMQHYGASTRLLDVSRSKYVALFFALKDMKKGTDGAVWAFDTVRADKMLYDELTSKVQGFYSDKAAIGNHDGIMPYQDVGWKIVNAAIGSEPAGKITDVPEDLKRCKTILNRCYSEGLVVHVVPNRINRRLLAQQGEFLFPLNINLTFVQNLIGAVGGNDYNGQLHEFADANMREQARKTTAQSVIKVVIPYSLREEFLGRLLEMNITYQTIFPDTEGFMRSLSFQQDRFRGGLKLTNSKNKGLKFSCNEFLL